MRRILFISIFFCSAAINAVPLSSVKTNQQNYKNSLGIVYNSIKAVEFNKDICAEIRPEFIQANAAAYSKWHIHHAQFLQEFEKRYSLYLNNLAGNNSLKYKQYVKIMNGKFAEQKTIRKAELKHMPILKVTMMCKNYPTLLETDLNPEKMHAKDIQVVRKKISNQ